MNIDNYHKVLAKNEGLWRSQKSQRKREKNFRSIVNEIKKESEVLVIWPGNCEFVKCILKKKVWIQNKNLYLTDISKWVIDTIKKDKELKSANIIHKDIFKLFDKEFSEKQFDLIILRHVIEHFEKDELERFIRRISEHMKKGATLLLETPNGFNLVYASYNFWVDFTHKQVITEMNLSQAFKMYFKGEFEERYYSFNVVPSKFSIMASIGYYVIKPIVSWLSKLVVRSYTQGKNWKDFLLCTIRKK